MRGAVLRVLEKNFDVEDYLATKDHKVSGGEYVLDCPCEACTQDGKRSKLWVRVKERQAVGSKPGAQAGAWRCWYSDDSGPGASSLVQLLEGCSFPEAIRRLLDGVRPSAELPSNLKEAVLSRLDALGKAEAPAAEDVRTPLPREAVPCGDEVPYVREKRISQAQAETYGLHVCRTGRYHDRLIVPVRRGGETYWFLARWMAKKPPAGVKKVLNSPGSNSSRFLYGVDEAAGCTRVVLVENVFSAMRVGRGGLATFGTHFSAAQLDVLARTDAEEVVVMWDRDASAKAKAGKTSIPAWDLAETLAPFWTVRVVVLPDARGPDEHVRSDLRRMVAAAAPISHEVSFRTKVFARLGVREKTGETSRTGYSQVAERAD